MILGHGYLYMGIDRDAYNEPPYNFHYEQPNQRWDFYRTPKGTKRGVEQREGPEGEEVSGYLRTGDGCTPLGLGAHC